MKKITLFLALVFSFISNAQMLTQSVSQTIMAENSVACVDFTVGIRDNKFYRTFPLSDFGITSPYSVTSIDFAVEQLSTDLAAGLPVIVKLYATTEIFPQNFPAGYTLLAEQTVSLFSETVSLHNVPMSAIAEAGSTLIVEIEIPITDSTFFQLGSNNLGQNSPSYVSSETCQINSPTDLATIGFAQMHSIINIQGEANLGIGEHALTQMSVFPNPTTGSAEIGLPPSVTLNSISISDISGKILTVSKSENIDLSAYANGIYLVTANTSIGEKMWKIVKN